MASAADNIGVEVENLAVPGFKISDASVENTCIMLEDALRDKSKRNIVVYHLFDNNVFFAAQPDGSRTLPVRDSTDMKYHMPGRLEMADHSVIKTLINISAPLLRAGGDAENIILSLLPRYLRRCCYDKAHLTNKKDPSYVINMAESLAEIRDSMSDLIHGKKIRSVKVLASSSLLQEGEETAAAAARVMNYWPEDDVHMSAEGYESLTRSILSSIQEGGFSNDGRRHSGSGGGPPPTYQPKVYPRQDWVAKDDTLARRDYGRGRTPHNIRGGSNRWNRGRGRGGEGVRGHGNFGSSKNKLWRGAGYRSRPY
jgi:hypothetical protein